MFAKIYDIRVVAPSGMEKRPQGKLCPCDRACFAYPPLSASARMYRKQADCYVVSRCLSKHPLQHSTSERSIVIW